ncbi:MAG: pyruvate dehydrogenase complex dihydrolipoamide acetyltransferase [Alphaproteobacteria bacterium]|nr:pyruvate dehydrogenase complex dihydrolipoamide acetyltransferase [Alphaproteobacteria bacterium]MBU0797782.1 pyruvate dehydrogenase complex dihydrolipoamide acetyltransferase [Alphaproteobacteria bacterium]MBU0887844.1 pyruvate dehydrogenase complex dihydrolipoamide acetyltransferase [Alphaproteobacteria bacterium]MBU1814933.1 pyruvate dehydrogenase complex dihydrolipoamide acetyltransferase [Alphaproteobacteria bacterium]
MPIKVLMPALSPTMTEGTLAKWLKKEGDTVASGDVIAEIETDKATMEVESADEGVLGKIIVPDGTEGVQVNAIIGWLLEEGEDASAIDAGGAAPAPKKEEPKAEAPKEQPKPEAAKPAAAAAPAATTEDKGDRVFASPLARRMAEQAGLDLSALSGSGPNGRIVKADIEAAMSKGSGKAAAAPAPQAAAASGGAPATLPQSQPDVPGLPSYTEVPNSMIRKVIAKRLMESKLTAPHFYLTIDCEIDKLLAVRKELNEKAGDSGYKLSVNDLVIRASALALKKVPAANATWTDAAIRIYDQVDISVAVAIDEGLITPVIRDAGSKGLIEISTEMKDLAKRARERKLKPEEFQGGTFSISNLGMFGIKDFAAVINPPQGAILAVGAGEQRPVVKDGALAIATVMSCTLSVDHRVVDGAVGAEFLAAFKKLIEDPMTMLL